MNKKSKTFLDIILRYAILFILALPGMTIFYYIFTPLTIYPTHFLLNIFFDANLHKNIIVLSNLVNIEIISACVAGSAYYLLLILNLSIQKIKLIKRIKMILFSFTALLVVNILRIFFLSLVYVYEVSLFDITHRLFWYLGSTIFVILIWLLEIYIFKVYKIPFVQDLKFLYKQTKLKR